MQRNEETLEAITYANRLPDDLGGRQCYVVDPMLATGGTLADAIRYLADRGADDITAVTLLAAPEGIKHVEEALSDLDIPDHRSSPARSTSGSTRRATSSPGLGRRRRPPVRRGLTPTGAAPTATPSRLTGRPSHPRAWPWS